ncbi:glutaminyl-peptide cyclotransferase [Aerococcaceae bacterium zg-BR9]|uniref:glutaminyl-peptide cyclotransferase n=1 Tax=Aerococcaceae bacterium zg-1292 TaxID=2774330 RepID=UPI0040634497|nr:glutaminyl-peptide cyclotransferase [Aerococcaceae bacterium zg-BR9]MBF6977946.1 glutaminyl-peptide cyclotransferase [Aerococcaceae bacterium zg-BR22]
MKRIFIFLGILLAFIACQQSVFAVGDVVLVERFPSDETAFVQGLELLEDGTLLMSTGLQGKSRIQTISPKNGKVQVRSKLDSSLFGEGITVTDSAVWQLTWKNGIAFKRDKKDLSKSEAYKFKGEGWGLAYDLKEKVLWQSDGTNLLMKRNPENFELLETISVRDGNLPVKSINELEFANDAIYANIWHTNKIIKINPKTGAVMKQWDLTELVQSLMVKKGDINRVLNGIAHIKGNEFYVTGKLYPEIWRVSLQ